MENTVREYREYLKTRPDMEQLMRGCKRNKDGCLDIGEVRSLIQVCFQLFVLTNELALSAFGLAHNRAANRYTRTARNGALARQVEVGGSREVGR